MARAEIKIVGAFKHMRVGASVMDQVIGAAVRERGRARSSILTDVYVFCLSYTAEAARRAKEIELSENIRIVFREMRGYGREPGPD